jgi:uncharacterized protein YegL
MKDSLTHITMVLDRSGSMSSVLRPTIDGFNEFVESQKAGEGDATITLIQFDTENSWEVVFEDRPVKQAPKLTPDVYFPRGGTPLHDAIGRTIVDLGERFKKMKEDDRPGKVIVVIMTDGLENSSVKYAAPKIAEMIKHQQDVYKWHFVFLGANQDAILTGEALNIPAMSALTYTASAAGTHNSFGVTGQSVNSLRANRTMSVSYSVEQRKAALEEDEK